MLLTDKILQTLDGKYILYKETKGRILKFQNKYFLFCHSNQTIGQADLETIKASNPSLVIPEEYKNEYQYGKWIHDGLTGYSNVDAEILEENVLYI